nr:tryptophan synthase beta chain 1 [Ipomoea batatas]GMD03255.1 tryptophan synthase beta chain 1 [Ipomoea batatas]GMD23929.1 tryptophan synthase beta chain 1 [Ipomoea batatas]GMD49557.1 tryptophan synthase beta chain 1 [Ipomoea batatas]GMD62740.1 tryptophan synthase beta chain 1 [Ipomoea batatas]
MNKFATRRAKAPAVFCTLTAGSVKQQMAAREASELTFLQRPDSFGRFGKFGGKYVPETLMYALDELEAAFKALSVDDAFQVTDSCTSFRHFI